MRRPAWLAEVIVQSISVTVSILLALWVDQWKQGRAEQSLAVVSLTNFQREIRQNRARLDDILPYHRGMRSLVMGLARGHAVHTPAEFQDAVAMDGLRPPFLLQTAWQTAVATGALTKIDYETVSALSLTYTMQDRFREESRAGMQALQQATNFSNGDPTNAIRAADLYLGEVISTEEDLRATYAQADQVIARKLRAVHAVPDTVAPVAQPPGARAPGSDTSPATPHGGAQE